MLNEGGVRGLWRGNGINVIKIAPESALKFCAYDLLKRKIRGNEDRDLFLYERFIAGSLAGGVSQSIIYPLEVTSIFYDIELFFISDNLLNKVMKTRMALRKSGEFTGIIDCVRKLYRAEGLKVFYKGYIPNLLG